MPLTPDASSAAPLHVHIVSHTHWDREWYQPLGRFRQRLVALVDELLDDPPPPGTSFLLDGQGIVIDDYLAVRPERRAELSALLREGRLEAGPWYVLADELIPAGEALVRNLLAGRRAVRSVRADPPPVLYCPDSFGHPAALPAIARGFGFEAVILWRGYGGARWPDGDAAWWDAPDGTRALLLHLPPDGYEFGSNLPADPAGAAARWNAMRAVLAPRARLGVALVQNGADHHARQHRHATAIAALVDAAQGDVPEASSLGAYVRDALAHAAHAELPLVHGELRDSYGYTWTLQGTFASRAFQKRTNAGVERALVRDAEPWAAIARARNGTARRGIVNAAWRSLLEAHPHDTLCGCSIDDVARAADVRWADAAAQAAGIRDDAVMELVHHEPATAREQRDAWRSVLLVRNRAPRSRSGVVRLTVDTFVADVGVGPGSAGQEITLPSPLPAPGISLPHQVLGESLVHARTESPRHYPDDDLVVRREVLARIGDVPGYGVVSLSLDGTQALPAVDTVVDATVDGQVLSNGLLRVHVGDDGAVDVASLDGSHATRHLVGFECRRDAGDLYTPAIREGAPAAVCVGTRVLHAGPLRAAMAMDWIVRGAGGADDSPATLILSLDAGEPFLRVSVTGEHRGHDQRLRLLLRTGVPDARVWADAAFGAVERRPIEVSAEEAARELPPPTGPLHRYVSLFGPPGGATVLSDGLAEYEAMHDGTVAITLVRAVAALSRHDLPERPGHAGWPCDTPEAQCRGPFAAELAVLFHRGERDTATVDVIERTADDVLLPLTGDTLRSALTVPEPVHGVTLEGPALAFSALKESEDGEWIVLRCVNLGDRSARGTWRLGWPVAEARTSRLDETPGDAVPVEQGSALSFDVPPHGVHTVLVR